jgi:hypothetical protein
MHVTAGKGTAPWLPEPEWFDQITMLVPSGQTVEFRLREPKDGYAYRGFHRGSYTLILVDLTETPDSVKWLLLHEMGHAAIDGAPYAAALRAIPKPPGYPLNDDAHEACLEEQLANETADRWSIMLGGVPGLGRRWWRERVRALGL